MLYSWIKRMKDKDSWVKVGLRDNNLTKGDHSVSGSYLPALILAMIALMESVM